MFTVPYIQPYSLPPRQTLIPIEQSAQPDLLLFFSFSSSLSLLFLFSSSLNSTFTHFFISSSSFFFSPSCCFSLAGLSDCVVEQRFCRTVGTPAPAVRDRARNRNSFLRSSSLSSFSSNPTDAASSHRFDPPSRGSPVYRPVQRVRTSRFKRIYLRFPELTTDSQQYRIRLGLFRFPRSAVNWVEIDDWRFLGGRTIERKKTKLVYLPSSSSGRLFACRSRSPPRLRRRLEKKETKNNRLSVDESSRLVNQHPVNK